MLQVQQLTDDHGKKWKAKEYGYNPRVAEKKGVIVKRIKEYLQTYQSDAQQVGLPRDLLVWRLSSGLATAAVAN